MPPRMNNGGFVSFDNYKVGISNGAGGFDWIPDNWKETVTVSADPGEEYKPVYGDWSFNVQNAKVSGKSWAWIIAGHNKSMTRRIIRHMEWWRRYALKTGTKAPEMFQSVLEVTGRAWRPKMPKL